MSSMFEDVVEFHTKILKLEPPEGVTLVSDDFIMERMRFLVEELEEYAEAGIAGDMVRVADALGDIVYVALGTAAQMGIPFNAVWDVIHAANMRKVKGITKRGNKNDAVKPEGWVGPEAAIAAILLRRIDNE